MAGISFLEYAVDMLKVGLIVIDQYGRIKAYNKKAKEIFGIIYNEGEGHPAGCIMPGDIVVVADNQLGRDDGGLEAKDFLRIGISEDGIYEGCGIAAVGIYGDKKTSSKKAGSKFKVSEPGEKNLILNHQVKGHEISIEMDFEKKHIHIKVNGKEYSSDYILSVGHMVVLDGKTGKVKFYQAKGYTARREDIKSLLSGKEFTSKGSAELIEVLGKSIYELHPHEKDIKEFLDAAKGTDRQFENELREINGRPIRSSIYSVKENQKTVGAALVVEDITELKNAMEERDQAVAVLRETEERWFTSFYDIIAVSESMKTVARLAAKAAESDSNVLLLGESGTGKSLLAECIHKAGKRKNNAFVHVNCASIPESLLESELFGYEPGAFTGAKKEGKAGLFEQADGGTLFLDEIGELPLHLQVKLLHAIQSKSFLKVGGTKPVHVDVRILTATNRDLEGAVSDGSFREDLYYRINVFPIYIPPLSMRKEDIYPLVHRLLPKVCRLAGCKEKILSSQALKELMEYSWPGNIRELENVLERAVNIMDGDVIYKEHLNIKREKPAAQTIDHELSLEAAVAEAERKTLAEALRITQNNKKEAMKLLKIGKTAFYEKLKKHGIDK